MDGRNKFCLTATVLGWPCRVHEAYVCPRTPGSGVPYPCRLNRTYRRFAGVQVHARSRIAEARRIVDLVNHVQERPTVGLRHRLSGLLPIILAFVLDRPRTENSPVRTGNIRRTTSLLGPTGPSYSFPDRAI